MKFLFNIFLLFSLVLDCSATLELDRHAATLAALGQNYYFPVGSKDPNEKQPFTLKWSILSFVFSGSTFAVCKFIWKLFENNHVTHLSSNCRETLSDPEKRVAMATDVVNYLNKCERGQYLMVKYVIANLISLGAMIGVLILYLSSVDFFNNPFSLSEFNKWTQTNVEERTDIMIKLFPRKLVFPYSSTGSSGTLQGSGILCTAVVNHLLEKLYASAILCLCVITSLQIMSMLLSLVTIGLFHITTTRNSKRLLGIRNLTYGQRLLLALLYKNMDYHLWCSVLDTIEENQHIVKEEVWINKGHMFRKQYEEHYIDKINIWPYYNFVI